MGPHMDRAGRVPSRSSAASPAPGAGGGSLAGSWLFFSLWGGKHKEGLSAASPAAAGRFWPPPTPALAQDLQNGSPRDSPEEVPLQAPHGAENGRGVGQGSAQPSSTLPDH